MINFLNGLVPDYKFESDLFEKVYGLPSELNQQLREGQLDISPVSSMEYMLNSSKYKILPGLCISAYKEVETVGVFSSFSPRDWDGKKIYLSGASLTSKYLLQILCKKYLKVSPIFIDQDMSVADSEDFHDIITKVDGILLIGDRVFEFQNSFDWKFNDLATLWYDFTSLPFVFALWLVRNEYADNNSDLVSKIHYKQLESVTAGLDSLEEIYSMDSKSLSLSQFKNFLENVMNYQMSPFELSAMKRFSQDLLELNLVKDFQGFNFFDSHC